MARISEIMLLKQAQQPALVIETKTNIAGLPNVIGDSFLKLGTYIEGLGEITTDVPFVAYHNFESMTEDNITIVVGFKLAKELPGKDDIKCIQLPEQKIVSCLHMGSFEELSDTYNELMQWIESKKLQFMGSAVEYYYTGPNTPENEQITRLEMPLA